MARLRNTLVTAEDVLRCDSPYRDCELRDGVPMVCSPSGGAADCVAGRIGARLGRHVEERDLGWTFASSQGFLLARNPDLLLSPDGAYVSRERLPTLPQRGFIEMAPDFLVEVRSPDDTWAAVVEKCDLWIAHGARCVWAVDPMRFLLCEFRGGGDVVRRTGEEIAKAVPALEGFTVALADLFRGLGPPVHP